MRRRDAARELLRLRRLRESFVLAEQPPLRNAALAGLQAAATAAIALPLVHLSPWSHLIGFAALGALVALFGRFAPVRRRNRIVLQCAIWQTLAVFTLSLAVWLGVPAAAQLVLLAAACGLFFFVTATGQYGAPGPLILVFAAGASMGQGLSFDQVIERTAATAAVAALAWAICAATERWRDHSLAGHPRLLEPVRPLGHRLTAAARITVGAAIAAFVSQALGAHHPAWAAMGALAVMQGTHLHISMNRALQRMVGTVGGALLAWALLSQDPSVWIIIGALVAMQIATEIVIGANYALGQILVTPMALLMTYLAAPGAAGTALASERVLDTLVGAGIGITLAVLLSSLDDRRHLARERD